MQKRILILAPEIPFPVFKGNQSRIHQTIKLLLEMGHDVALAVLNFNQKDQKSSEVETRLKDIYGIKYVGVRKHSRLSNDKYLKFKNQLKNKIIKTIDKSLVSNVDSCPNNYKILVEQMVHDFAPTHILVNYVKLDRAVPKSFLGEKIIDTHDIQSEILRSAEKISGKKSNFDFDLFEKEEFNRLSNYGKIISINKNETKKIASKISKGLVFTLPVFYDKQENHIHGNEKYDLLFVGSASPFNSEGVKWFIRNCFHLIKKTNPGLSLAIAGEVGNIASVQALKKDGIFYLGRVNDLSEVYRNSKIVISPIFDGAGMKVKNIEAFSHGMPVVATPFSMDGIEAQHNVNCLICEDSKEFVFAVNQILKDENFRLKLSQAAFNLATSLYSKTYAASIYSSILNNSVDGLNYFPAIEVGGGLSIAKKEKRIKALIYSSDAAFLLENKISVADNLREIGVYSEFIVMDSFRKNRFLEAGYISHSVRGFLTKSRRNEIKKELVKNGFGEDGRSIKFKGIDITEDFSVYKKMFPGHFEGKKKIDVIAHGFLILEVILKFVEKVKPDFLVGWNGNGPHFIFLMKVAAKIAKKPIFHVERGLLPKTLVFDSRGVNFKSCVAGSYLPLINEAERKNAKKYIDDFKKSRLTIVKNNDLPKKSPDEIKKEYGLNFKDNFIFFPMQIEGDSNIVINSPFYKTMEQVLSELLVVAEMLKVKLVCRPHPENNIDISVFASKYPDVIFDSRNHLHDILGASSVNVVINSTVGLESILIGKPTIALGYASYTGKGITFDVMGVNAISETCLKIFNGKIDGFELERKTEELLIYLMSESLLDEGGGERNWGVLERNLNRNGIFLTNKFNPPKDPKVVQDYKKYLSEYFNAIKNASRIKIINELPVGTRRWLNGVQKPEVNNKMIEDHFSTYGRDKFIYPWVEGAVSAEADVYIVIIASSQTENIKKINNTYYVDEYFSLKA